MWAPSVIQVSDKFVMYYTARDMTADKQCIGVASGDKPEGKFKDTSDKPLVCVPDEGGDIDPAPLADGGKLYLYWKNDGNCCGITTYIYAQELSPDGLSLVGQPTRLIENNQGWEGRVIEGPQMFKHDTAITSSSRRQLRRLHVRRGLCHLRWPDRPLQAGPGRRKPHPAQQNGVPSLSSSGRAVRAFSRWATRRGCIITYGTRSAAREATAANVARQSRLEERQTRSGGTDHRPRTQAKTSVTPLSVISCQLSVTISSLSLLTTQTTDNYVMKGA